mmetsp:Transcript_11249/g.22622  ORF Transcript_11249/g.22622 Transcript_11249/m.22622 type:complete len:203 (+) Transcript_11249:587-1195(+)
MGTGRRPHLQVSIVITSVVFNGVDLPASPPTANKYFMSGETANPKSKRPVFRKSGSLSQRPGFSVSSAMDPMEDIMGVASVSSNLCGVNSAFLGGSTIRGGIFMLPGTPATPPAIDSTSFAVDFESNGGSWNDIVVDFPSLLGLCGLVSSFIAILEDGIVFLIISSEGGGGLESGVLTNSGLSPDTLTKLDVLRVVIVFVSS